MKRAAVVVAAVLAFALPTLAKVRVGGFAVGGGYTHFGPRYYPYYYGGPWFYGPGFYGAGFYYPAYGAFARGPGMGEVKLRSDLRDAEVFLNGAYAGQARDLKSMWLRSGAYNLELRANGRTSYSRRIYVLSGKTIRVDAQLTEVRP